jgi:hypothetical protein
MEGRKERLAARGRGREKLAEWRRLMGRDSGVTRERDSAEQSS